MKLRQATDAEKSVISQRLLTLLPTWQQPTGVSVHLLGKDTITATAFDPRKETTNTFLSMNVSHEFKQLMIADEAYGTVSTENYSGWIYDPQLDELTHRVNGTLHYLSHGKPTLINFRHSFLAFHNHGVEHNVDGPAGLFFKERQVVYAFMGERYPSTKKTVHGDLLISWMLSLANKRLQIYKSELAYIRQGHYTPSDASQLNAYENLIQALIKKRDIYHNQPLNSLEEFHDKANPVGGVAPYTNLATVMSNPEWQTGGYVAHLTTTANTSTSQEVARINPNRVVEAIENYHNNVKKTRNDDAAGKGRQQEGSLQGCRNKDCDIDSGDNGSIPNKEHEGSREVFDEVSDSESHEVRGR